MTTPAPLITGNLTLDAVNKAVVGINAAISSVNNPGTVTSVSVATANGVSGTVANATTTPAITLTVGTVGGVVVTGASSPALAVSGTTTVSGANTGDQTLSSLGAAAIAAAQTFTHGQRVGATALTSTSNDTAIDLSLNNNFTATLTEDTTLANPTNIVAGQSGRIAITQAAGDYTVAFDTYYKFPGGSTPSVSTGTGALDLLYYDIVDSTHICCNLVKAFS